MSEAAHSTLPELRKYVGPYAWTLVIALLLVSVVGVLEAVSPFLIGMVFDTILEQSETPPLVTPFFDIPLNLAPQYGIWLLAALVSVTILKAIAEYGSVAATAYLGQSVVRDLRTDVYSSIVSQPIGFFAQYPTGELISRVSADVEKVQSAVSETLAEFLKQGAILLFLLVAIYRAVPYPNPGDARLVYRLPERHRHPLGRRELYQNARRGAPRQSK